MKTTTIEIRVRPVARYIVTEYTRVDFGDSYPGASSSVEIGEFKNVESANRVAQDLGKAKNGRYTWASTAGGVQLPSDEHTVVIVGTSEAV